MAEVPLKCSCGTVKGIANDVTPDSGSRVVCYCKDCQDFAEYLSCTDKIVDENGGTDIFQLTPSQIKITEGAEQIRCIRLSSKGLFRWYTQCCQTPIGNTLAAGMPFVGLVHNFMDNANSRDASLGSIRGCFYAKSAIGSLPAEIKNSGFPLRLMLRTMRKILVWKLKGLNKPSPFFDADGDPVSKPNIL